MAVNIDGHRAQFRYNKVEKISVKIVFSSENPGLLGRKIEGSTLDVSSGGMKLMLNNPIRIDSVLDVWVSTPDQNRKYFLTGNVRWCNESEKPGVYQIGLVLRERSDTTTDLTSWQETFK
ncbi:MAG: PilZ domain-containing protein [Gammaproteobacteria bacterium]|jgi:PilZ domain|nr:PilZ domain-containing protein [Gammaproteobacteria bacterium]